MSGQVWSVNTLGGYSYSDQLSTLMRTVLQPACKCRQLCDPKDGTPEGYGKELHTGEKFHWNVYANTQDAGGPIAETQVMPTTNVKITQGSLTVTEYGVEVPFTGKLDDLSLQPVSEIIRKALKNNAKKALDQAAYDQFNDTPLVVCPASGTSTTAIELAEAGTPSQTNNVALGKGHVKIIVDVMIERNIPGFTGDDYMVLGHPTTFTQLDTDLEPVHQYTETGYAKIVSGERGRYHGARFVQQSNIAKETWTNGKSNWAFFIGEDTVTEAIVIPEEIRGKIPSAYGRDKGVAWYYLGGFGLVHTLAMGTELGIGAADCRILKWASVG